MEKSTANPTSRYRKSQKKACMESSLNPCPSNQPLAPPDPVELLSSNLPSAGTTSPTNLWSNSPDNCKTSKMNSNRPMKKFDHSNSSTPQNKFRVWRKKLRNTKNLTEPWNCKWTKPVSKLTPTKKNSWKNLQKDLNFSNPKKSRGKENGLNSKRKSRGCKPRSKKEPKEMKCWTNWQ